MSLSVGIVGLPNAGKSTIFNALIQRELARTASYPFTTVEPNIGMVSVFDKRLQDLAKVLKGAPDAIKPVALKFIDIAGLVENAHLGAGLGNRFLSKIREVDVLLHVVRVFEDDTVPHILEKINPERDIKVINVELLAAGIDKPTLIYHNRDWPDKTILEWLIRQCYQLLDLITVYTIEHPEYVQAWPIARGLTVREVAGKIHSEFREKFIKAEVTPSTDLLKVASYQEAKRHGWVAIEGREYVVIDGDVIKILHG